MECFPGDKQTQTSCSLLDMKQLSGKIHHVWKPFLDGVDKKVHQRLFTVLRLGVYQLTTQHHIKLHYIKTSIYSRLSKLRLQRPL